MSERATTRRGLLLKGLLGLLITSALVLLLFQYVDLPHVLKVLSALDWSLALVGFVIWVGMYLARMVRFVLLAPRTPHLTMFCIASVHNFLLRVLPMRTGDLSYAFLVKRAGTAGLGESLLGLLLLRVMDAAAVVLLFAFTLGLQGDTYLGDRRWGVLASAGAVLLFAIVILAMGRLLRLGLSVLRAVARLLRIEGRRRVEELLAKVSRAVEDFSRVGRGTVLKIAGVSLVQWLLTYGAFFVIMRAFSVPVGVAQTVLGATAAVVTAFLPIGGIGSFGTLEAGWAAGFVLVGLERETAIATGFGTSLTTFVYSAILGLLGWIGLGAAARRRAA